MRRKRILLYALLAVGVVGVVLLIIYVNGGFRRDSSANLFAVAERGTFRIEVEVTGELLAVESVPVLAPASLMRGTSVRMGDVTIQDLVPEGTIVDSGDYVGSLDRNALTNAMKDVRAAIEKAEQKYLKVQLDTALTLRELRNSLQNLKFSLEERQLVLDQSKYEPPATIRQAELNLEKVQREYTQAQENYRLKLRQSQATMREAALELAAEQRKVEDLEKLDEAFTIRAPCHGMVIYHRDFMDGKLKVGGKVSFWDPTIAELPDLTNMYSKTYVNEVDVSLVRRGQPVRVGLDAFPGVFYKGRVEKVANVGEELDGSTAKVFEVEIGIVGEDSLMRPSMTTTNVILVLEQDSVLMVPLECVHTQDSVQFVYSSRRVRQQVALGRANATHVVIERGVEEGEKLYLSIPARGEEWTFLRLEPRPVGERAATAPEPEFEDDLGTVEEGEEDAESAVQDLLGGIPGITIERK